MPQINKVERDHDIKQVSRKEDLRPAMEKPVAKAKPQIQNKRQLKETAEITEQNNTASLNMPMKAARRAGMAAIRHAKTISDDSGKAEDQEAVDKLETTARNTMADTTDVALDARDSLKRRIKKKSPDIKNTRDIKTGARTINKADRSIKSSTEATRVAAKGANEAAKQAAITSQKIATAKESLKVSRS